jgi:hypothetical protein
MVEQRGPARTSPDVVPRPQLAEALAPRRQLLDQRGHSRIVIDQRPDRRAERRDDLLRPLLPAGLGASGLRIEEVRPLREAHGLRPDRRAPGAQEPAELALSTAHGISIG